MELRHLRYVVALAEELHFGNAAARLGISQPPLSQQLAALETELGVRLFDRNRRGVVLTVAGRHFVEAARAALRAAEHARSVAMHAARGELGELRLGLFTSAPLSQGVAATIGSFRACYPGVRLFLTEAPSRQQVEAIAAGTLDAGFLRSPCRPLLPDGLDALEAVKEPLCVVLPYDHALARRCGSVHLAELAGEPMVFFSRAFSPAMHDHIHALCMTSGFMPHIVQEANANAMILGLVATGIGVSILPAAQCAMRPGRVHCRAIADRAAVTGSWVAFRKEDASLPTRNFVALVERQGISLEPLPGQLHGAVEP